MISISSSEIRQHCATQRNSYNAATREDSQSNHLITVVFGRVHPLVQLPMLIFLEKSKCLSPIKFYGEILSDFSVWNWNHLDGQDKDLIEAQRGEVDPEFPGLILCWRSSLGWLARDLSDRGVDVSFAHFFTTLCSRPWQFWRKYWLLLKFENHFQHFHSNCTVFAAFTKVELSVTNKAYDRNWSHLTGCRCAQRWKAARFENSFNN